MSDKMKTAVRITGIVAGSTVAIIGNPLAGCIIVFIVMFET